MLLPITRREFIETSIASASLALWDSSLTRTLAANEPRKEQLPVAAVVTVYTHWSHADVIVGKVLEGWQQDGGPGPDLKLASLYVDQFPDNDLSVGLSKKYGFPIAKTISEALTLGTDSLAVGGVLLVGEHGNYPTVPETEQVMFPRRRFFDETVATYRKYGKVVPTFCDKHLSYAWDDAKQMYDTARELQIPFMAGSSVPLMWRQPSETIPMESEITEAFALGDGGLEVHGFHALEGMQCLMERRRGGETGVKSVQAVKGDGIWQAEKAGLWSKSLFNAVLEVAPTPYNGRVARPKEMDKDTVFYLIEYRDGTKATIAMNTKLSHEFACAASIRGREKPFAVTFLAQEGPPYGHFETLLKAVQQMMQTLIPAYPVERTLLTTGILDAALHSLADKSTRLETPHLAISYEPVDWPFPKGMPPPPRV